MVEYIVTVRIENSTKKHKPQSVTWELYKRIQIKHALTTNTTYFHKFLTGLFGLNTKFNGDFYVTERTAKLFQIVLGNQELELWQEGLSILEQKGKTEAWDWFKKKLPVLKLRNKLEGT